MAQGGWSIRLYEPGNFRKGYDIISNFKGYHNRTLDDVMVFNGMYGLDSYMLWYIHKDLHGYDFNSVHLNLRLFTELDKSKSFWENKYRVVEVKYDPNVSKYVLLALSEDSIVLNTKLMTWKISSIKFDEKRTASQVLADVLEENNILAVQFFKSSNEELIDFEYKQLTFDPDWTVRDFINYICDDNKYEWYVYDKVLHVGRELPARESMNITTKYAEERDQIAESAFFRKVIGDLRPADVLGHINKKWKCIWAKHIVGKSGGVTKACFSKIGSGRVDKKLFLHTLEGQREIINASYIFSGGKFNSYSVGMGSILKDEGESLYVDEVSVQKDTDTYKVRNPSEMVFDRGNEDETSKIVSQKEHIARSTPYLDHEAGLFFPSVKLDKPPPNSIIFNVKDREESSVLGPFVVSKAKDLVIPVKGKLDFRLQFPNGWCLYVKEAGDTILQLEDVDPTKILDDVGIGKMGMHLILENPQGDKEYVMSLDDSNLIEFKSSDEGFKVLADGTILLMSNKNVLISAINENIEISSTLGKTLIQGGGNKLSHADHKHLTGNMGIPVPAHIPIEGTINTEAD